MRLEKEIFNLRVELAIKKLKEKIIESSFPQDY